MSKQRARQLKAVKRIAELASKVANEDIQDEIDSLFANIGSACILIEQAIQKEAP